MKAAVLREVNQPLELEDVPLDLYMVGKLKLDEPVSRTYPLEKINEAFTAMKNGEVARSVIAF